MEMLPGFVPKPERRRTTIFFFLSGLITATWASRIPDVQERLELNAAAWGRVLSALPLGLMTGLAISSWLVSRFGTQRVMYIACILCALMLCLTGFTSSPLQLAGSLFCIGLSRTIMNIAMNTHSLRVQQLYDKPIISTFHGIWSLACFAAAGVGTFMIIEQVMPATHFMVVAFICILVSLLAKGRNTYDAGTERRPFFVVPDRFLTLLGIAAFCGMLGEGVMFDWGVNYFDKAVKASPELVTIGYTTFIISMAVGRLAGDFFIARFGAVRLLVFNGLLMAAGFALAAALPFLLPAATGFLLIGIGDATVVPIIYSLSAKSRKMSPGYALASVTFIGYSGFLIGPVLVGWLSETAGMPLAFAIVGMISVCLSVLALLIRKTSEVRA